jgi:UDP-glucose 4-epimerase
VSRVLVTGGAGFIGSNVARMLLDRGDEVVVYDDLSTGREELVDPRATLVVAGLADTAALDRALAGCDAAMHFAASSIIAGSFSDPLGYVENNVVNGTRLVEAMRRAGTGQLVFSSSAAVYGEPRVVPVPEDHPKDPIQLYGASKLAFEVVLGGYAQAFGFDSVSLRYFNAYGPADLQEPVTRAVPAWVRAGLRGEPLRMYWGGRQRRDYVFVEDIAEAHLRVLGLPGRRVYNIGTGDGVLMLDVVAALGTALGRGLEVEDAGERPGDPMRLVADTSAIERDLGWKPRIGLAQGLERTVAWYRANRELWDRGR